ncbi:MAG: tetratricopeptide repeat protein [Spirochaetales bacterium]|nr:tetratricopeptide repeat protein [Spirochaetales bacterium]
MAPNKKVHVFVFISILLCIGPAAALEIAFRLTPQASIPFGGDQKELYSLGASGSFNADFIFAGLIGLGPEAGWELTRVDASSSIPQFVRFGPALTVSAYPFSRVFAQAGVSGGIYEWFYDGETYGDFWYRAWGEAGFRFSPSMSVSAAAGWSTYLFNASVNETGGPMYSGLSAGLSLRYLLDTRSSTGGVDALLHQDEPVFPLVYSVYRDSSLGSVRITNQETAEIRNVRVSFRAGDYTASTVFCGSIPVLAKRKSGDIPVTADFSEAIQQFTENGKFPAEMVVSYTVLGEQRESVRPVVVETYNRNMARWTDSRILASFISPNAPEVLDLSKYVVGMARDRLRTGLNRNMQFAMYLFESLRISGLAVNGGDTPYEAFHLDPAALDSIQYPFQTLSYRSGDLDDIGILFAALLESVGIRTAFIPLPDDFVVAFALDIDAAAAEGLFSGYDRLLDIDGSVWIPLSCKTLKEGFINSWYTAVSAIGSEAEAGRDVDFVDLRSAWLSYPAARITGSGVKSDKPEEALISSAVETNLRRYIGAEFGPKIREIQEKILAEGSTPALNNQLGLLYVRAGMYAEAKKFYALAADKQSVPAMVNLGNIALLEKDLSSAERWFRRALDIQEDNRGALSGLERVLADQVN